MDGEIFFGNGVLRFLRFLALGGVFSIFQQTVWLDQECEKLRMNIGELQKVKGQNPMCHNLEH